MSLTPSGGEYSPHTGHIRDRFTFNRSRFADAKARTPGPSSCASPRRFPVREFLLALALLRLWSLRYPYPFALACCFPAR
jgi:hypothetical protein